MADPRSPKKKLDLKNLVSIEENKIKTQEKILNAFLEREKARIAFHKANVFLQENYSSGLTSSRTWIDTLEKHFESKLQEPESSGIISEESQPSSVLLPDPLISKASVSAKKPLAPGQKTKSQKAREKAKRKAEKQAKEHLELISKIGGIPSPAPPPETNQIEKYLEEIKDPLSKKRKLSDLEQEKEEDKNKLS